MHHGKNLTQSLLHMLIVMLVRGVECGVSHLQCCDGVLAHSPSPPAGLEHRAWLALLTIPTRHDDRGKVSSAGHTAGRGSAVRVRFNMCVFDPRMRTPHLASPELVPSRVLVDGGAAARPPEVPADGGLSGAGLLCGLWHVFTCRSPCTRHQNKLCSERRWAAPRCLQNTAAHVLRSLVARE